MRRAIAVALCALSVASAAAATPRDRAYWPKYPVTTHDLEVRHVEWRKFVNLARCEAGPGPGYGRVRWQTPRGWTYQGGTGMYSRTHQSVGHPYQRDIGQANWQTQVLVAERVRQRYGITAWGAHACWR